MTDTAFALRRWVKARNHPLADAAYRAVRGLRRIECPVVPGLHAALYALHTGLRAAGGTLRRVLWDTPLFKTRLSGPAPGLYLYGGIPLVLGAVRMTVGDGCRMSGQTTITGRTGGAGVPELSVGRNVDIGWQTTIAVGHRIVLGDDVRIAGRAFLAGYPGHPLDPAARAAGRPETEEQVGDIVLEDGVWLATGVFVTAGVRIGRGTVVAAGSVVTGDLPPMVLAGGVPARVIRPLAMNGSRIPMGKSPA